MTVFAKITIKEFRYSRVLPNVLSTVFHPLLMPAVGTLFILFGSGLYITLLPVHAKEMILWIVGSCTVAMPVLSVFLYRVYYSDGAPPFSKRRERLFTMLLTAIFYYFAWQVLHVMHTPAIIQRVVLVAMITVCVSSVVSCFRNISIHGVGAGGVIGIMAALCTVSLPLLPAFTGVILLSGVVGYARIRLNTHTPAQYYAGVLLGFAVAFGTFSLF
ncbi:MAG: hypothetical protein LBS09_08880 [Bacteroidales bacterium]|jgi:hypothetical protein|nr:hypothetical protein [Bacteroidales bacterium]